MNRVKLSELEQNTQFLTLGHYKLPLKPVEQGFGYLGAVSVTLDGEKIQCHECGGLYANLACHVKQVHMPAKEYREKYQLAPTNSLISEKERERMVEVGKRIYQSMSVEERQALHQKRNEALKAWRAQVQLKGRYQPKESLEHKNIKGTCPDQLLEHIKKVATHFGRTPTLKDLIEYDKGSQRYKHLIFTTFGSWKNALKILEMSPETANATAEKGYIKRKGRGLGMKSGYGKEALLEHLRMFYEERGKIPTSSDFKRGLLPTEDAYKRNFGSIKHARFLAGIEGTPTRWGITREELIRDNAN